MYRPGGYVSNPQYMPGSGGPPPYQQHYGTMPPQQQNYNYGPPANMPGQHPSMSHEINTQMHFAPNQVNHYSGNPYGMPNYAAPRPTYEQQQYPGPPIPGPPPQFSMPQAVTSQAPHMQPPAFSPVPQNFPQNYANPSYQNPQLSQQQQQQQQQQYPVYASQQVNSQFPNLPQVLPQAPPPEPSEEPAFSVDPAASGNSNLLPPPPPPPSDEEMVQNIEVLSEFVARNGPDFENMARAKENGNQKFSFLFNGVPGSDAAVGHQYYQWMKKKWELEINGQKFQHDQPGMQLESSGARQNMVDANAAANSSPRAASDMEMDDDLAPVDPVKLKNVSPQELTHTKVAQLEEVKPRNNALVWRAMMVFFGKESTMATVMEEEHVIWVRAVHHMEECLADVHSCGLREGRIRVNHDLYVFILELKSTYQDLFHSVHIVDAAFELSLGVGIVAPHQHCFPCHSN